MDHRRDGSFNIGWCDSVTEHWPVPAVAQHYQQPLNPLIEEPLKVVSVNNCSVETGSPQKNKLAILCFPCVVAGNSLSKEIFCEWGWGGGFFCLLIHYALKSSEKWPRKWKFIEICFGWRGWPAFHGASNGDFWSLRTWTVFVAARRGRNV